MSNFFWKKLNLCFSSSGNLLRLSPSIPSSPPSTKTDHNRPFHRRIRNHSQSIFIHNFNFLYDHLSSPHHHRRNISDIVAEPIRDGSCIGDGIGGVEAEFAGFATVFSSKKPRHTTEEDGNDVAVSKLLSGGVAVMKHVESPDPYRDFRRSMREMVEARNPTTTTRDDREFLHELLFCYLSLNPKHTHKFIVSAFADTLVSLLSPSSPTPDDSD